MMNGQYGSIYINGSFVGNGVIDRSIGIAMSDSRDDNAVDVLINGYCRSPSNIKVLDKSKVKKSCKESVEERLNAILQG